MRYKNGGISPKHLWNCEDTDAEPRNSAIKTPNEQVKPAHRLRAPDALYHGTAGSAEWFPLQILSGQELVARLPNGFLRGMPQQLLGILIPEHNALTCVHCPHAIPGMSEESQDSVHHQPPESPCELVRLHRGSDKERKTPGT
jgi:hypothetical protein